MSVSLDKVAGIEQARGDLDAALAKYEESLEIRRLLAEELGTPQSDADVRWNLRKCRDISIESSQFGRALAFANECWEVTLSKYRKDESASAIEHQLSQLIPVMRCGIELAMQPDADNSAVVANRLIDSLVAACEDPTVDKEEQCLDSVTLFRCAEAIELCARVHRMSSTSVAEAAAMSRATELRARAEVLSASENAEPDGESPA